MTLSSREQRTAPQQGNLPVTHIHFNFGGGLKCHRRQGTKVCLSLFCFFGIFFFKTITAESVFFGILAGGTGEQHRAQGAGGSGVCGAGEGERPQMQKVQKDQQTGER